MINSDLKRYTQRKGVLGHLNAYFKTANYRVVFWFRLHLKLKGIPIIHIITDLIYWKVAFNRSVEIPSKVVIKEGLHLIHSGVVIINSGAVIGRNFTVVSSLNIGNITHGKNKGVPVIGDNVYVGTNVCILGNVKVGDNVLIGANSVVLHDLPDNSVAVGSPAKPVNFEGSGEYILNPVELY